jgi:hypothetical protein
MRTVLLLLAGCNHAALPAPAPGGAPDLATPALPWMLDGDPGVCPADRPTDGASCAKSIVCFYLQSCGADARVQCGNQFTGALVWDTTDETVCPDARPACPAAPPSGACDTRLAGFLCAYFKTGSWDIYFYQCDAGSWQAAGLTNVAMDQQPWLQCAEGQPCEPRTSDGCALDGKVCKCGDDHLLHC